jgi:long-chain acyl-CoA synthetase
MNFADVLTRSSTSYSNKPICVFNEDEVPYDVFVNQVSRLTTALLEMGAKKDARVGLLMSNRPEWLVSFLAIIATGAVAVPINPGLAGPEVCAIVDHCGPVVVIVQSDYVGLLNGASVPPVLCIYDGNDSHWHQLVAGALPVANFARMDAGDPALIFYTSGTTGRPKGVVLSHGAELFAVEMFSQHLGITPKDTSLITGSLAFIYHVVINAMTAINNGATIVLLDRFHPQLACLAVERRRVTLMMAVPTAYVMMLNWSEGKGCDLSSMRFAITGGANFPAALSQRISAGLGFPVFDLWGMTECTPATAYDPARDRDGRPDSCGRPLPGFTIRIVDERMQDLPANEVGEILLTSPAVMTCYYKNPEATGETVVNGWVCSGDLGKLDTDGFLYIIGRKKDMIVRGGANIYPVDVEEVLYKCDAVGECAVIGVPDSTYGELVKAFVVLKEGLAASESEIIEHCRRNIAQYKSPSMVEFVASLPKGPTGKILRRSLR